jgi:predicted Rossmann fold nucleotide-binding protein DprA/Smf involved in DNA uptake
LSKVTIRIGHDAYGHHSLGQRQTRTPGPIYKTGKEPVKRMGIDRQPERQRIASELPITERHEAILEQVGTEPTSSRTIAETLGLSRSGVNSSLYALQDRGLVQRIQYKGWVRT